MRVLNIVNGIAVVLLNRKVEVKVHLCIGFAGVEQEARAVNGYLLEQVAELDRLACTLTHFDWLAVAQEIDELHQHHGELVAVAADCVHRALHAHDVTVVVGAPDVNERREAALKFIFVISDIGGKIGRVAVFTNQHIVLQLEVVDVLLCLALGKQLASENFFVFVPHRSFALIGQTLFGQQVNDSLDRAALVQLALEEPLVIGDSVGRHVLLHLLDVLGQSVIDKRLFALLGADIQESIAVKVVIFVCKVGDIAALIAVLREFDLVALVDLQVACLEGIREFLNLVARVIDIELTVSGIARLVEHRRETVAQRAASRVAHVHGTRGVRGDKFHHHLFALAEVRAAVALGIGENLRNDRGVVAAAEEEIDEARSRGLEAVEKGTAEVEVFRDRLRDFERRHAERFRSCHRRVGREISVRGVRGCFDDKVGQSRFRKRACRDCFFDCRLYRCVKLRDSLCICVHVLISFLCVIRSASFLP